MSIKQSVLIKMIRAKYIELVEHRKEYRCKQAESLEDLQKQYGKVIKITSEIAALKSWLRGSQLYQELCLHNLSA